MRLAITSWPMWKSRSFMVCSSREGLRLIGYAAAEHVPLSLFKRSISCEGEPSERWQSSFDIRLSSTSPLADPPIPCPVGHVQPQRESCGAVLYHTGSRRRRAAAYRHTRERAEPVEQDTVRLVLECGNRLRGAEGMVFPLDHHEVVSMAYAPGRTSRRQPKDAVTWRAQLAALRYVPALLQLMWHTHRGYTAAMAVLRLLRACIPLAALWVGKLIIDIVVAVREASTDVARLWELVAPDIGIVLVGEVLTSVS